MSTEISQRDQSREDKKIPGGSTPQEIQPADLGKVSGGTSPVNNGTGMGSGMGDLSGTDIGGGAVSDNANQQQDRLDDLRNQVGLGLGSGMGSGSGGSMIK